MLLHDRHIAESAAAVHQKVELLLQVVPKFNLPQGHQLLVEAEQATVGDTGSCCCQGP